MITCIFLQSPFSTKAMFSQAFLSVLSICSGTTYGSLITLALSVSIVMLKLLTGLKKRQKRRNMNATQARLQTKDSIPFTFGKCCQIMAKIGDFLKTGRGVQWPRWCLKQIIIDFCCPNRTCRLLQPKSWFILGKLSWEKSCLLLFCLGVLRL